MKKNIQDSQIIEKIKNAKVEPNKNFRKLLLTSLKKEYKGKTKKSLWQNFIILKKNIMNLKRITIGIFITVILLITTGAFNSSYANDKKNIFDYIDSGIDFIILGVKEVTLIDDFIKSENDKPFMDITGIEENIILKNKGYDLILEDTPLLEKKLEKIGGKLFIGEGEGIYVPEDMERKMFKNGITTNFGELSDKEIIKKLEVIGFSDSEIKKVLKSRLFKDVIEFAPGIGYEEIEQITKEGITIIE
ncbi:MAG: hypothetical protein Q9M94_06920 [Candidatus Gracilibacteria bacterium]|nr:hypothetical protein [Candidatus Gracilibacteria bacterium]